MPSQTTTHSALPVLRLRASVDARVFTAVEGSEELLDLPRSVWLEADNFGASLVEPEDRVDMMRSFSRVMVRRSPQQLLFRVRDNEGRRRWLSGWVAVSDRSDGELEAVLLDTTEAVMRERSLIAQLQIGEVVADRGPVKAMIPSVLRILAEHGEWDYAEFWELDDERLRLTATHLSRPDLQGLVSHNRTVSRAHGEGLPGRAWSDGGPVWVDDMSRSPIPADRMTILEEYGLRSALAVPVRAPDHYLGSLVLSSSELRPVDTHQLTVAVNVARQLERALARVGATFVSPIDVNAVIEGALDPITAFDMNGHVLEWNAAAQRVFGWTKDEILGQDARSLMLPADRPSSDDAFFNTWLHEMLEKKGAERYETSFLTREGKLIPCEISVSVNPGTENPLFIATIRDLTDIRLIEEKVMESQKLEQLGRLVGGIAHDFNNSLLVINGWADELTSRLTQVGENSLARDAGEINKAARRAAELTQQLVAFSRRQELDLQILDLNKIIREAEPLLRATVGDSTSLDMSLADDIGLVSVDAAQMQQVLLNLTSNARDAMPAGGRLLIETHNVEVMDGSVGTTADLYPGSYVSVSVTDTGEGMDAETCRRCFEPFFTTKAPEHGTGLGLASVYGTVKQSGGTLTVHSEAGKGTTFRMYFPHQNLPDGGSQAELDATIPSETPHGHETILLVEDDELVLAMVQVMLEQLGYNVVSASSGREALKVIEGSSQSVDLLISDVVMPGIDGVELAERLRSQHPQTKALFTSGYTADAALEHGVPSTEVFLQKPFDITALARRVRDIIDESSAQTG